MADYVAPAPQRVASPFSGWCFPRFHTDTDIQTRIQSYVFLAASYLTDSVCKVREYYWQAAIVDKLHPTATKVQWAATRFLLYTGILACGVISLCTTLPGIALRYLGIFIQKEPFIHLKGCRTCELTVDNSFTLFSWNVCCVAGGYAITDGGVAPWTYRIDAIAEAIKKQYADVVCLYEVFDTGAAFYLYEKLKSQYAHFYLNIGPKAVGVSSGIFVASRYSIVRSQFIPFSADDLVRRTKNACKGVFSFELVRLGMNYTTTESFARIHATHLQHSEEPAFPTLEERGARQREMKVVQHIMQSKPFNGAEILTGDLNMDEDEFESLKLDLSFSGKTQKTWGGDASCVPLLHSRKRSSGPLTLDYTLLLRESAQSLSTDYISSGYNPNSIQPDALSDHLGLRSTIRL